MPPSFHEPQADHDPTRREFLRLSALTAAAAAAHPLLRAPARAERGGRVRGNSRPGEIVIYHDAALHGEGTIDLAATEAAVHHGVRLLTGEADTGVAFASLFPSLTTTTTIGIKVNCIGPCDTRWESVRGIVSGLAQMLDGSYDITQIRIYDNRYIGGHGYTAANFDFDGIQPVIATGTSCTSGHYPVSGHQLSDYAYYSDYLINVPALKSHSDPHEVTLSLKNHYGSCCPPNICATGGPPKMLDLNTDSHIKEKTALIVLDGLRGTYSGGPGGAPQSWSLYPEGTPNTLFFSTDPITTDYWGRDTINAERAARGWSLKDADWIETGAEPPHELGVCDPELMTVRRYDPAGIDGDGPAPAGLGWLPNVPNPFQDATQLRFRLPRAAVVRVTIVDAGGRRVRRLAERTFPAGYGDLRWDGRDDAGRRTASGAYFARLEFERVTVSRRLLRVRG